jgi:hypothetical protein
MGMNAEQGTQPNLDAASLSAGAGPVDPDMVSRIFERVREIKRRHPDLSRRVDVLESEVRDRLMAIKDTIDAFPAMERELITVLVINGIHKMSDEILIDDLTDEYPSSDPRTDNAKDSE